MPYINKERRKVLGRLLETPVAYPKTAGELNYRLTMTMLDYCVEKEVGYQLINEIMGAIECAKLEFYRRVAAPYEDVKITENGDVY